MLIPITTGMTAALIVFLTLAQAPAAWAAEVDFSCVSEKVWPKKHLSNRFREFDVVLQNDCPGPVYWSMCIERIDAQSNSVWETLTPSGYVANGKKARVNLQTKKNRSKTPFRQRYEEFYVNIGYAIDRAASANCQAKSCETRKADLRASIRRNEAAWEQAARSMQLKIDNDCPDAGWDTAARQECANGIRADSEPQMNEFDETDQKLRKQIAAIDPENCTVYSGALVTE